VFYVSQQNRGGSSLPGPTESKPGATPHGNDQSLSGGGGPLTGGVGVDREEKKNSTREATKKFGEISDKAFVNLNSESDFRSRTLRNNGDRNNNYQKIPSISMFKRVGCGRKDRVGFVKSISGLERLLVSLKRSDMKVNSSWDSTRGEARTTEQSHIANCISTVYHFACSS